MRLEVDKGFVSVRYASEAFLLMILVCTGGTLTLNFITISPKILNY